MSKRAVDIHVIEGGEKGEGKKGHKPILRIGRLPRRIGAFKWKPLI